LRQLGSRELNSHEELHLLQIHFVSSFVVTPEVFEASQKKLGEAVSSAEGGNEVAEGSANLEAREETLRQMQAAHIVNRKELEESRAELRVAISQLESLNEELQTANEELLTNSEELQCANEELQVMNEELHSFNAASQMRISDLRELQREYDSILGASGVSALVLDVDFRFLHCIDPLKKFEAFRSQDAGRPFSELGGVFGSDVLLLAINAKNKGTQEEGLIQFNGEDFETVAMPIFVSSGDLVKIAIVFSLAETVIPELQGSHLPSSRITTQGMEN
jgi:hypothetical protein